MYHSTRKIKNKKGGWSGREKVVELRGRNKQYGSVVVWIPEKQLNINNVSPGIWKSQFQLAEMKAETEKVSACATSVFSKYVAYNLLLRGELVFVSSLFRQSRWAQDLFLKIHFKSEINAYQGETGFIDMSVCRDLFFDEPIQCPSGTLIHAECRVNAKTRDSDFNLHKWLQFIGS